MIERDELTAWARRFGVAEAQVARDHFVSHILAALADAAPDVRFFGGTALCRTLLDETRLSEDIDLLDPEPRKVLDEIKADLPRSLRNEFPDSAWGRDGAEGDGFVYFLVWKDIRPIKVYVGHDSVDTAAWEFARTDVSLRYNDLPATVEFPCPTLPTFAAMKLAAWYDRHAPRDLFDLAGLAGHPNLDRVEVQSVLERKLGYGFIDAEMTRVPASVDNAWDTELGAQVGELASAVECLRRAGRVFTSLPDGADRQPQ